MSSPAQGGPSVPSDRSKGRRGLGRLVSRMKTLVRRPRRQRGEGIETGLSVPVEEPDEVDLVPVVTSVHPPRPPVESDAEQVPRAQLFEERAKKLAERYGLELAPSTWHSTEGQALRVEKPIKMRVHRHCHECKTKGTATSFGLARECPACGHARCKECPRVPPWRTEEEKEASRKKREAIIKNRAETAPIVPDWDLSKKKVVLWKPAKSGGQDLIYRKPRQRVRRYCCQDECKSLFVSGSKQCGQCGHQRCTDCPRGPAKSSKYPYGYPGDVPGEKLGHFTCSHCGHIYPSHPKAEAECPQCHTKKDESHTRQAPKKVEPEPDPELWEAVQVRLDALSINTT